MLNLYEINALMKTTAMEREHIGQLSRELRAESARQAAEHRLRKEVERFLKCDGNVQVVIESLTRDARQPTTQQGHSAYCS